MEFDSSVNAQDKSKHENPTDIQKVDTLRTNDVLPPGDTSIEANTEVPITADDVIRAGGVGAVDDLNSILPVASDFGDHLLKSDVYEEEDDAFVTSDEVIRAGGFGAKDDISSFLPVASDFTDFEANLRGAREYEDVDEEVKHPGLGWTRG